MKINRAKTLQIFLPSGDPLGIREALITTALIRVIEVPKTGELLADFFAMPESSGSAVYFLVEGDTDEPKRRVYIGQTSDVKTRISRHLGEKSFWQKVLVASSRAESLTPAHILHLECICIARAKKSGRFIVENDKDGQKHLVTKHLEAECEDLFDTTSMLLATLGLDLFTPVVAPDSKVLAYQCTQAGVVAHGQYTKDGMVVLKGSKARAAVTENFKQKAMYQTRLKLLETGVLSPEGDYLLFTDNHLFGSPSTAASLVVGNNVNGWEAWKTEGGKTLDEVIRKVATP